VPSFPLLSLPINVIYFFRKRNIIFATLECGMVMLLVASVGSGFGHVTHV